jgi:filamentous hemagglutinin family protein
MLRISALRCRLLSASAVASVFSFATLAASAGALPGTGHYVSGKGEIGKAGRSLAVKQSSTTGIIDWNNFSIGKHEGVTFDNGAGATLNRITGGNLSRIAGSLHATGSLYLMNSRGVIVSRSGRVMTGGSFVASSGSGDGFGSDSRRFRSAAAAVVNRGSIVAGKSVNLLGGNVRNQGTIRAASVDLKAARKLVIEGSIAAHKAGGSGGSVTARARTIVIDASGHIDASAVQAGRKGGTVSIVARHATTVGGTIAADGGTSGAGGFVETSGRHVHVGDGAAISTLAAGGKTGRWLIDPQDFTIAASGGDITGAALSAELATTGVDIQSSAGATAGNGDIFVDDAIAWSSSKTLTLDAYRNIIVEAPIAISGAGSLVLIDADTTGTGVNDGNAADGTYSIDAPVMFTDVVNDLTKGALRIDGTKFTLVNSIGQLATDIAGNASGNYALADSYNAKADGTYASAPVPTTFTGIFEGLGNTISNLTIDDTTASDYVGFFVQIGDGSGGGTVRDIGLVNAHVTGSGAYDTVGGLVADNFYGASITNAYITGAVKGGDYTGGLAGTNTGTISYSYSAAAVSGGSFMGGLVGTNTGTDGSGTINDSYATGAVTGGAGVQDVGGLAGENYATINNSYSTGMVSVGAGSSLIGGLVGADYNAINNSYWDTDTSGQGSSSGGSPLTDAQMRTASSFSTWTFGTGGNVSGWVIVDGDGSLNNAGGAAGGTTPMLLNEYSIALSNAHQLQLMALNLTADYTLLNNIQAGATAGGDVWGAAGFIPVGGNGALGFTGNFDGNGYTVSGLTIVNTLNSDVGLFGETENGSVGNLKIADAAISSSVDSNIGILAGLNEDATISGVQSSGAVTLDTTFGNAGGLLGDNGGVLENASSSAEVSDAATGAYYLGGLIGYSTGTVDGSSASGGVSGSGNAGVGGLIGSNAGGGAVTDSHASGKVSISEGSEGVAGGLIGYDLTGQIYDSHASGSVTGNEYSQVGGLIGYGHQDTITDSYAGGAVSGQDAEAGGLVGASEFSNIAGSHAGGKVTVTYGSGTLTYAGGLVGFAKGDGHGSILDSYATGAVTVTGPAAGAGGLVGDADDGMFIASSYASGAVSAQGTDAANGYGGGLVGELQDASSISDSYAKGKISGNNTSDDGGLVGYMDNGNTVTNSYATGNVEGMYAGGLIGWSYDGNVITESYATGNITGKPNASNQAFVGGLIGDTQIDGALMSLYATGTVNGGDAANGYAGGLIGYGDSSVSLIDSHASGAVEGAFYEGGLVADSVLAISQSYATGAVTGQGHIGGLVGYNDGMIFQSYATGEVNGATGHDVGGLVGENELTVLQSFATGTVDGQYSAAGGLIGENYGMVSQSYAIGAVLGGGEYSDAGGLIGNNQGGVEQSYAVGLVEGGGGGYSGGLIAQNLGGTIAASYWDTQTTGQSTSNGGAGLTTARLQSALPSGFSGGDWAIVKGVSFPYLKWQVASGTPEVVSGTISAETSDSDIEVDLRVNGKAVMPLVTMSSGANGYYYELLAPGTISHTGSDVLAYLKVNSGHANTVYQNAKGSLAGFNLIADTLTVTSSAKSETALLAAIEKALGSNGGSDLLFDSAGAFTSGIDLNLDLSTAAFSIDHAIDIGTGTLTFDAAGSISQANGDAITAATLTGQSGGAATFTSAANAIADLGAFATAGNFALTDNADLTVVGKVGAGSHNIVLTTKGASHDIAVHAKLEAAALKLISAGAISENGQGDMDVAQLSGSSVGAAQMTGSGNAVADLGAFTSGGPFALTDDHALTVDGTLSAGSQNVHLTTTGGHALAIEAKIVGATVDLVSAKTISESGAGAIHATTLTGSAHGTVELTGVNNVVAELGPFTTGGNNAFAFTDNAALTVVGNINAGAAGLSLTTLGKDHNLAINHTIAGKTINLVTTGAASESKNGAIRASKLLNVTAGTGITLTSKKNAIEKLGTDTTTSGPNKVTL